MAIEISSIKFTDEFTGSGATKNDFLMGSFGDKLTAYVTVAVHWEALQILVTFNSANKTIKRQDNYSFIRDGFIVGDTIQITGTTAGVNDGSFTITAITDSTITVSQAVTTGTYSLVDINGTTSIDALNFYYNLIENSSPLSFVSLTDNQSTQRYNAGKATWVAAETVSLVDATQSIGWQTGTGTVIKNSISNVASNYIQEFVITHTFYVTPFYLSGDLVYSDSKLVYPSFFLNTNSLKYVARVDGRFSKTNPTIPHTTPIDYNYALGNVGWFNEFLNGGTPEYSLYSVRYVDTLTNTIISEIQIDRQTTVYITTKSLNQRFTGSCLQALSIFYCPNDESDYVGTKTTDLLENFLFDHALITSGAGSINGVNYGTNYQAIKTITSVNTSTTYCLTTFIVDLSSATQALLEAKATDNRKLMLMITPQYAAATTLGTTDRNAVYVDFNDASIDLDDSTLLAFSDSLFYQYPDLVNNAYTDFKGMIGDQILAKTQFVIEETATPLDITVQILAVNSSTDESFELQKYTQTFPESELNGAICTTLVVPTILGYKLPSDDPRNQAYLTRNVAIDTATGYGFEMNYGFVARYETWRELQEFNEAFSCDHSQDWSIYSLKQNWSLKYLVTVNVSKNDYTTTFERIADLTINDDLYTNDGFGGLITASKATYYDLAGTLVDSKGLIWSDTNTWVVITFNGDFSALPTDAIDYYAYLALDIEGTGGAFFRDIAPSDSQIQEDSAWGAMTVITKISNTEITISSYLDYTKLDLQNNKYLITGRFGFKY